MADQALREGATPSPLRMFDSLQLLAVGATKLPVAAVRWL